MSDELAAARLAVYISLLRRPRAARLLVGHALASLPFAMVPLGILLLVHAASGSFAGAGLVTGCYALTAAVAAPAKGRQLDVRGTSNVLALFAAANVGALTLLAFSIRLGGVWLAAVAAVAASATTPAVSPSMRARWPEIAGNQRELTAAYGIDAIVSDVIYVIGPLLVGGLTALVAPEAAILAAAGFALTGTLLYVSAEDRAPVKAAGADRSLALRMGSFLAHWLSVIPVAAAIGAVDVGLTAFAAAEGRAADAGFLLALLSFASLFGGFAYGAVRWRGAVRVRYAALMGLFALVLTLLTLPRSLAVMAPLVVAAGLLLSPVTAAMYAATAEVVPVDRRVEAFAWVATGLSLGNAAGTAIAGWLVDTVGVARALLLPACACALSCAVAAVATRVEVRRGPARAAPDST